MYIVTPQSVQCHALACTVLYLGLYIGTQYVEYHTSLCIVLLVHYTYFCQLVGYFPSSAYSFQILSHHSSTCQDANGNTMSGGNEMKGVVLCVRHAMHFVCGRCKVQETLMFCCRQHFNLHVVAASDYTVFDLSLCLQCCCSV